MCVSYVSLEVMVAGHNFNIHSYSPWFSISSKVRMDYSCDAKSVHKHVCVALLNLFWWCVVNYINELTLIEHSNSFLQSDTYPFVNFPFLKQRLEDLMDKIRQVDRHI